MSPVEEIKSKIDPVQFIGEYVKLQRAGINWKALCPFHQEKTPSFFVSPTRGTWRCFGCNKGGDIFSFVMEKEGLSFRDALEMLARRAGVQLRPERPEVRKEREELFSILESAAIFFESKLADEEGRKAAEYLKNRGLKLETIKEFRIGYAPNAWDSLLKYLAPLGHQPELIEKAGLIIKKPTTDNLRLTTNPYYDRFRGRIMFPLFDLVGRIVGFSGRILPEFENASSGGKYVNSPETPLFQKSRILYGLDKAKSEIQRAGFALMVEGQMDLLMTYQEGLKNVIATSGTALTPLHLVVLKRYTPKLVFAFDQDTAGANATERAITMAVTMGFDVRIAVFDEKDPAELARQDPAKLRKNIANALFVMAYYIDRAFKDFDAQTLEGKTALVRWILPKIKAIPNLIERSHWLEVLSSRLRIPTSSLEGELAKITVETIPRTSTEFGIDTSEPILQADENLPSLPKTRTEILAERLIAVWLAKPQTSQGIPEALKSALPSVWQEIYEFIKSDRQGDVLQLDSAPLHLIPYIEGAMLRKEWEEAIGVSSYSEQEFSEIINEIRREINREKVKELTFIIRETEQKGDSDKLQSLLRELKEISKELSQ